MAIPPVDHLTHARLEGSSAQPVQTAALIQDIPGAGAVDGLPIDGAAIETVQGINFYPDLEAPRTAAETATAAFVDMMRAVHHQDAHLKELSRDAVENRGEFNVQRLVALQRTSYEYALTLDLAAKVTDRVSQGLQTLIRNQ